MSIETLANVFEETKARRNGTKEQTFSDIVIVTPDHAKKLLDESNFEGQRHVRDWHVKEYADCMRKKQWKKNSVINFQRHEDKLFMIDGQHRLLAVIESNLPQQFLFLIEDVETEEEIRTNYTRVDVGLNRTIGETLSVLGLSEKTGLTSAQISKLNSAIGVIESGFAMAGRSKLTAKHRNREQIAERVLLWQNEAVAFFGCMTVQHGFQNRSMNTYVSKSSVMSVALVTIRDCKEKAVPFWQSIIMNDGLRAGSGEQVAVEIILGKSEQKLGKAHLCRLIANCWNAYYEDRTIRGTLVRDHTAPIKILGTKYR